MRGRRRIKMRGRPIRMRRRMRLRRRMGSWGWGRGFAEGLFARPRSAFGSMIPLANRPVIKPEGLW
jgi:hypothetical protein